MPNKKRLRRPTYAKSGTKRPQTQGIPPVGPPPLQPRTLRRRLSWLDKTFRNVWFYIAVALALVSATYSFRPQLVVQVASPLDNPTAALFTLTNNGAWTLYNLTLGCEFNDTLLIDDSAKFRGLHSIIEGNPTIDSLSPGQSATRDCSTVKINIPQATVRIDFIVSYNWMWGISTSHLTRHFDTRRVGGHIILVPDVEPDVYSLSRSVHRPRP